MKKSAATIVLLAAAAPAAAQQPGASHFRVETLAPGVWAAIAADSGHAVCNAGIVDLGDATLVFDPFISPEAADELRRAAEALTGREVRYVVLSHWHNDHIRGAQAFVGAQVVGTAATRDLILEREPRVIEWEKGVLAERLERARRELADAVEPGRRREAAFWASYWEAIAGSHGVLETTPPALAFERRLALHGTRRSIELIELDGHTTSDAVLWLPGEGIAFLGDLLFVDRHPWLPDGDPDAHRAALRAVRELGVRRVVPGHGPVRGPDALTAMAGYIDAVEALGRELAAAGATQDEAAGAAVPSSYDDWWYGEFFPANLRFMTRRARDDDARSR